MNYARASDTNYILRLDPGDDVLACIADFATKQNIRNAEITGLGSIESPTLAHYRKDKQAFTKQQFDGIHEIAGLTGNIGLIDNKPAPHIHVTIANESFQAYAGHLAAGTCSATIELVVGVFPSSFTKSHNAETGLNVWQLESTSPESRSLK